MLFSILKYVEFNREEYVYTETLVTITLNRLVAIDDVETVETAVTMLMQSAFAAFSETSGKMFLYEDCILLSVHFAQLAMNKHASNC